ncbi:hypothetical protein AWB74_08536 [Caballeronia arvi]|uniref:Uncharacterized protein n=1 Tax=Caballeronia arvi TaxID=1777135 RepID=A0A158L524_9BURK|nr:hypothetical protein AWB74_08536 [Caballeronia arvi]
MRHFRYWDPPRHAGQFLHVNDVVAGAVFIMKENVNYGIFNT